MTRPRESLVLALVQRRLDLGLTLRDVAWLRGLAHAPGHVARLEKGEVNPTLPVLLSWANALDCDLVLVPREAKDKGAA